MLQAIIFDHDGTLVDSEKLHFSIWRDLLDDFAIQFDELDYAQHYAGVPTQQNAEHLVTNFGLDIHAGDLAKLKQTKVDWYLEQQSFSLMPHAQQTVVWCHRQGLHLALASGARRIEVETSLTAQGWTELFSSVCCTEDVKHPKPAPDVYQLALAELQLPAQRCLAIEDSYSGLSSAKAAGLRCIAVPNIYSAKHDFSNADFIAESLEQAIEIITQLQKPAG